MRPISVLNVGSKDITNINRRVLEIPEERFQFASDGMMALDILANSERLPDLIIISNFEMPVINGRALSQRIKTDERYSGIPILITHDVEDDYKEVLKHNGVHYLTKPYETSKFKKLVNDIVR